MFISPYLNNALNSIHKRALHPIYKDYELPSDTILEKNKQKNITYFLQGISNIKPVPGKIKDIGNIKQT